jgi:hypothetical protein
MNDFLLFIIIIIVILLLMSLIASNKLISVVSMLAGIFVIINVYLTHKDKLACIYNSNRRNNNADDAIREADFIDSEKTNYRNGNKNNQINEVNEVDEIDELDKLIDKNISKYYKPTNIKTDDIFEQKKVYAEDLYNERDKKRQDRFNKAYIISSLPGQSVKQIRDMEIPKYDDEWIDRPFESIFYNQRNFQT